MLISVMAVHTFINRNISVVPFFVVGSCNCAFLAQIYIISHTLAVKNKSVKSDQIFGMWLKLLPTNDFCRLFFLNDQNFYRPVLFTDGYFLFKRFSDLNFHEFLE